MKRAILFVLLCSSTVALAAEFTTTPQDYRLPENQGERSTYVQHRIFQGNEFGIMYEQGGFAIGKPSIVGYCLWKNAGSIKGCTDDHDSRLTAFIESLKGPMLECSNRKTKFSIEIDGDKFKMSAAMEAISEADGFVYLPWFKSEAALSYDKDSDCPEEIRPAKAPVNYSSVRICLKDIMSTVGTVRIRGVGKDPESSETLNCKSINGFAKFVADDGATAPAGEAQPSAGMRD